VESLWRLWITRRSAAGLPGKVLGQMVGGRWAGWRVPRRPRSLTAGTHVRRRASSAGIGGVRRPTIQSAPSSFGAASGVDRSEREVARNP